MSIIFFLRPRFETGEVTPPPIIPPRPKEEFEPISPFFFLEGTIVVPKTPAILCYGEDINDAWGFVREFVGAAKVLFTVRKNNQFILEGEETPDIEKGTGLWAKFDSSRNPLGWWAFVRDSWRRFFTPTPGEIRWIIGDSTNPPAGWRVVVRGSGIGDDIVDKLEKQYVKVSLGKYSLFAVRYVGEE